MKDFSKKITEKIKKEHILLNSKLKTHWKNYAFWTALSLIILLGSLFFSLIILNVVDLGPELARSLKLRKFFFLIFVTMPYLWMALLAVTVFSGFMVFRKTKRGYRYGILFVASIIVLAISVLGALVHFSKIDSRLDRGIPGSDKFVRPMEGRWQRPGDGLLGGEIIKIESAGLFLMKTPRGDDWKVLYSDETEIKKGLKIEKGERIRIVGEKKNGHVFEAFVIMQPPFKGSQVKGAEKEKPRCSPGECRLSQ